MLCIGTIVDEAPYSNTYTWLKIFYHSTKERKRDFLPTKHYFFRYDADCHWLTRGYHFENTLLRFLFGPWVLGSSNILKLAYHSSSREMTDPMLLSTYSFQSRTCKNSGSGMSKSSITSHYGSCLTRSRNLSRGTTRLYSRTLRASCSSTWQTTGSSSGAIKNYYKVLEEKVVELGGIKTLITHNYYIEAKF